MRCRRVVSELHLCLEVASNEGGREPCQLVLHRSSLSSVPAPCASASLLLLPSMLLLPLLPATERRCVARNHRSSNQRRLFLMRGRRRLWGWWLWWWWWLLLRRRKNRILMLTRCFAAGRCVVEQRMHVRHWRSKTQDSRLLLMRAPFRPRPHSNARRVLAPSCYTCMGVGMMLALLALVTVPIRAPSRLLVRCEGSEVVVLLAARRSMRLLLAARNARSSRLLLAPEHARCRSGRGKSGGGGVRCRLSVSLCLFVGWGRETAAYSSSSRSYSWRSVGMASSSALIVGNACIVMNVVIHVPKP